MNTCKIVEGRLMEINVAAGYRSVADVDAMLDLMKATIGKVPADKRIVIFADWRKCGLFKEDVAERVTWMLTRDNPKIERSAILHSDTHTVFLLQVGRLIRDGGHADRRVFAHAQEAITYLSAKLTPAERDRLETAVKQQT